MNIAFAASECVPFSKTGGLADVVGALPRALAELGHSVTVYLPRYKHTKLNHMRTVLGSVTVPFADQHRFCAVLDGGRQSGVQFYFIDYPPFFDREGLYGTPAGDYPDNAERFALFSRAVVEAVKVLGVPDVFHCHDWQAALVPVLLRTVYANDPAFREAATVMTIHNIAYQGVFPADRLPLLMLPEELFSIGKLEFWGKINFLKGALVFSDRITTVSRKYSQEVQTPEFGSGLEGVLRERAGKFSGILNGVDYNEWNPEKDKLILTQYSLGTMESKHGCKRDLLRQFGLESANPEMPLIGIISRLAEHKGFDLIAEVADDLAQLPLIMTVLGSGERRYEDLFRDLSARFHDKFAYKTGYDNVMAHRIEAGADMFLMPSRFEPCGLNQMYSLKYGTVPIVRATGGLDDTIESWDPASGRGTGFKFTEYSGNELLATLRTALETFNDKPAWKKIMMNGMVKDFSWHASAKEYAKLYEGLKGGGTEKAVGR
ncbi:MAG: glycogen synthase GlgA [Acidobacteriia bacterium]|nr:glycogen synthase GlgA [Terriglobia bacterium]